MIRCPLCKSKDIEGRGIIQSDDNYIWRRKKCYSCGKYFRTIEIPTMDNPDKIVSNPSWLERKLHD